MTSSQNRRRAAGRGAWIADRPRTALRPAAKLPTDPARRLEALHRQAGALTHDFNNLLTVIMSASDALSGQLAGQAEQQGLAQVTLKAAEQGAELLRRLLDLANDTPAPAPTADCAAACAAAGRFARHAVPRGVRLEIAEPAEPLVCAADPADLESALLNLCINAGDAICGAGTIEVSVRGVELSRRAAAELGLADGAYVRISVRDDGAGMDAETLARATEPFFTTKRNRGGTGLGLAGVEAFAQRSDGRLVLVSQPGAGATATLYLPRAGRAART